MPAVLPPSPLETLSLKVRAVLDVHVRFGYFAPDCGGVEAGDGDDAVAAAAAAAGTCTRSATERRRFSAFAESAATAAAAAAAAGSGGTDGVPANRAPLEVLQAHGRRSQATRFGYVRRHQRTVQSNLLQSTLGRADPRNGPLVVSGPRGSGKSALLTAFAGGMLATAQARRAMLRGAQGGGAGTAQTPINSGASRWGKLSAAANLRGHAASNDALTNALDNVACFSFFEPAGFSHLVIVSSGEVPELRDPAAVMYRICAEIKRVFGAETAVPTSTTQLAATFAQWLAFAATKGSLTLLLDAVEELDGSSAAAHVCRRALDAQELEAAAAAQAEELGWGGAEGGGDKRKRAQAVSVGDALWWLPRSYPKRVTVALSVCDGAAADAHRGIFLAPPLPELHNHRQALREQQRQKRPPLLPARAAEPAMPPSNLRDGGGGGAQAAAAAAAAAATARSAARKPRRALGARESLLRCLSRDGGGSVGGGGGVGTVRPEELCVPPLTFAQRVAMAEAATAAAPWGNLRWRAKGAAAQVAQQAAVAGVVGGAEGAGGWLWTTTVAGEDALARFVVSLPQCSNALFLRTLLHEITVASPGDGGGETVAVSSLGGGADAYSKADAAAAALAADRESDLVNDNLFVAPDSRSLFNWLFHAMEARPTLVSDTAGEEAGAQSSVHMTNLDGSSLLASSSLSKRGGGGVKAQVSVGAAAIAAATAAAQRVAAATAHVKQHRGYDGDILHLLFAAEMGGGLSEDELAEATCVLRGIRRDPPMSAARSSGAGGGGGGGGGRQQLADWHSNSAELWRADSHIDPYFAVNWSAARRRLVPHHVCVAAGRCVLASGAMRDRIAAHALSGSPKRLLRCVDVLLRYFGGVAAEANAAAAAAAAEEDAAAKAADANAGVAPPVAAGAGMPRADELTGRDGRACVMLSWLWRLRASLVEHDVGGGGGGGASGGSGATSDKAVHAANAADRAEDQTVAALHAVAQRRLKRVEAAALARADATAARAAAGAACRVHAWGAVASWQGFPLVFGGGVFGRLQLQQQMSGLGETVLAEGEGDGGGSVPQGRAAGAASRGGDGKLGSAAAATFHRLLRQFCVAQKLGPLLPKEGRVSASDGCKVQLGEGARNIFLLGQLALDCGVSQRMGLRLSELGLAVVFGAGSLDELQTSFRRQEAEAGSRTAMQATSAAAHHEVEGVSAQDIAAAAAKAAGEDVPTPAAAAAAAAAAAGTAATDSKGAAKAGAGVPAKRARAVGGRRKARRPMLAAAIVSRMVSMCTGGAREALTAAGQRRAHDRAVAAANLAQRECRERQEQGAGDDSEDGDESGSEDEDDDAEDGGGGGMEEGSPRAGLTEAAVAMASAAAKRTLSTLRRTATASNAAAADGGAAAAASGGVQSAVATGGGVRFAASATPLTAESLRRIDSRSRPSPRRASRRNSNRSQLSVVSMRSGVSGVSGRSGRSASIMSAASGSYSQSSCSDNDASSAEEGTNRASARVRRRLQEQRLDARAAAKQKGVGGGAAADADEGDANGGMRRRHGGRVNVTERLRMLQGLCQGLLEDHPAVAQTLRGTVGTISRSLWRSTRSKQQDAPKVLRKQGDKSVYTSGWEDALPDFAKKAKAAALAAATAAAGGNGSGSETGDTMSRAPWMSSTTALSSRQGGGSGGGRKSSALSSRADWSPRSNLH